MTDHRHDAGRDVSDVHALSGAYAVDALDDLERARFEAHLAQCADCRDEVAGLQETATLLGIDDAVAPPAQVRDAVLSGIESVRPLPPRVPHRPARVARSLTSRGLLVAASVVAVLALAGAIVLNPFGGSDNGQPSATERVMAAADATRVHQELPSGATATVVLSRAEGRAVILTDDMDPPPSGHVYELWLQTPGGDMVPAGLMPDRSDTVMLLDGDASQATAVGITVEPEGGSPQPTSDPIALFALDT